MLLCVDKTTYCFYFYVKYSQAVDLLFQISFSVNTIMERRQKELILCILFFENCFTQLWSPALKQKCTRLLLSVIAINYLFHWKFIKV